MTGPIRNACVARGNLAIGANQVVYTVPAATVLLLKGVLVHAEAGGTYSIRIELQAPSPGVNVLLVEWLSTTGEMTSWSGWAALNAGDQVLVDTAQIPVAYWLSGALLPYNPALQ